ncbi:MAG: N-6 DNA methylase [Ignavibacteriae bacterium]|nr:N-6 DNA methylase [Ignavibacteriota bacterium]
MNSSKTYFENYTQSISAKFSHPTTSEMGYRTDFEILLKGIFESINVSRIDHDAKAVKGNKPDFIILKFGVPLLYIEAKDIGVSLDKVEKSEQMERYFGYANLVLTDYVEFRFYRNGEKYQEPIKIAEYDLKSRTLNSLPNNFELAAKTLIDFTQSHKEPIKSGLHLAKIMGGKAQRIRDNLLQFLSKDSEKNVEINKIYKTLKKLLVHDLKLENFADMYAQTLVYGLFVARYFDETPENFSRREARDLVPKSNPFLRHFFDHITGADFDKRLEFIVDELCVVFSHANISELMKQYFKDDLWGKANDGPDPVIHFYEDFLREYDAELRKKMGAYYTPQPVVRFIVRAVDHILKTEFNLPNGLADTSKLENGNHKVQILDPAVGTGTFISAAIRNIYEHLLKTGQKGRWTSYVHHDLLPRIHGFEIMMAPYTIAHLKLSMAFKETGFNHFNRRLGIYLTNSLEEADNLSDLFTGFGFAESIAEESKEAIQIKNETPIMVVLGNPPYSVSSSNKGKWITDLIKEYKKDLNEKNIQPLSDDYIKFIRYAEHFVEKNKSGIVAMITNNSFLDGIIHRQMRKHLLETFDEIYILDLHGNSKKKETAPDGSKDENVFNIMQGVSISIMIKKNIKTKTSEVYKNLATVKFAELYGKRNEKFENLNSNNLNTIKWNELKITEPNFFFTKKDFSEKDEYEKGFKIDKLFANYASGVATAKDGFIIKFTQAEIKELKISFEKYTNKEIAQKNKIDLNKVELVKNDLPNIVNDFTQILYRPFDIRYSLYSPNSDGVYQRPRPEIMKHLLQKNIAILTCKKQTSFDFQHIYLSKNIVDRCSVSLQTGEVGYAFPLYLYSKDGTKIPNLNNEILEKIEYIVGKTEPEEILDYIYAILHSPNYRKKYKEFLKIDFPRVPYPKDKNTFNKLVKLGTELRQLHLLESPKVNQFITTFPNLGSDIVEKINYTNGNVIINEEQYFGNVPEIVWNFYIGGYQPAQKWLKDRKGRTLTNDEIEHYQKIIVALTETNRIMQEIDFE